MRRMLAGLVAVVSIGGALAACGTSAPIFRFPVLISAGDHHTCGQDGAGVLECWGDNSAGELGDGSNTSSKTPVPVTGLSKVFDLSTAHDRTCIVTAYGGAVQCWGDNSNGGLGDNTVTNRMVPTQVVGLTSGWKSVRVGYAFTCALSVAGAVKCWGALPSSPGLTTTPADVAGLEGAVGEIPVGQITVGHDHACAVLNNGAVECWGDNGNGEIGVASPNPVYPPVAVTGMSSGVTDVAAGFGTTCAVKSTVDYCWGSNNWGQVGDGTTTDTPSPLAVVGVGGSAFRASISDRYSCVLSNNSGVGAQCWGKNDLGQLGDGTTNSRTTLDYVSGLSTGVVSFSAGTSAHGCAVLTGGAAKCWGLNTDGEVGDGNTSGIPVTTPVNVIGF